MMQIYKLILDIRMHGGIVMLSRSEASLCPARQTLRGVYPERSEWAQGDSIEADFIIRLIF